MKRSADDKEVCQKYGIWNKTTISNFWVKNFCVKKQTDLPLIFK